MNQPTPDPPLIDQKVYARIVETVMAQFAMGKQLLDYDELPAVAESIDCSEKDVILAVTIMSFEFPPFLRPEFYRLENAQRIPVPPETVSALIAMRESDQSKYKNIAQEIYLCWRLF